jgi:hypothetical protein
MVTRIRWIVFLSGAAWIAMAPSPSMAQLPYSGSVRIARGQDITPAFEGWMANPDGTFTLYFGYMNRNYEEELDIPVGADNNIEPGGDRGQPTHFYTRRQRLMFSVVVPKDWGRERKLVWTLSVHGRTNVAKGWLQPEWEIDKEVIMLNAAGAADLENEPPVITGSGPQTITLPNAATLTATAKDDGRPGPRRLRDVEGGNGLSTPGLSIRWIYYRGPGPVSLSSETDAGGNQRAVTSTTKATFRVPGVYVLRAIASDGSLSAFYDVAVTVK